MANSYQLGSFDLGFPTGNIDQAHVGACEAAPRRLLQSSSSWPCGFSGQARRLSHSLCWAVLSGTVMTEARHSFPVFCGVADTLRASFCFPAAVHLLLAGPSQIADWSLEGRRDRPGIDLLNLLKPSIHRLGDSTWVEEFFSGDVPQATNIIPPPAGFLSVFQIRFRDVF